ncbi:MAG: hypothetical protein JKY65_25920 [Planctomycetes bacterium]|nr:hypothetical protein [Planctomycetota bacterium]
MKGLRRAGIGVALAITIGCVGDPQPAPGTEPLPAATPAGGKTPSGASESPTSGDRLRFQATEHGLLIRDPVTGFSLTTPGAAKPSGGGGDGPLAYELQAKRRGWALRIRREAVPKGRNPQVHAKNLVRTRALRKPVEITPFRPATCARWGVDAAIGGTYPLGRGEAWERVIVLVRAQRAIVLWETVDTSLGRPLITELNGRCYASFRWGGSPRNMKRTHSAYVDAQARLSPRGQRLAQELRRTLTPDDLAQAEDLLARLAYSASDPPDELLQPRDRGLIKDKLSGLGKLAAARLKKELAAGVRTPRDLRGLHQVLDAASR